MLLGLKISNIAIIDEAEVTLGPGLTVLTGETGAGKSILIDALGLLLGLRADAEVIRGGCDDALVEAIFEKTSLLASRLSALGLPDLGDEVSIRRVVSRRSRGKVYVNGAMVTVGVLGTLMRGLLDISGQHESISLFDASLHRSILDRLGNLEPLVSDYRLGLKQFADIEQRIADLGDGEQRIQQRIEFLKFQKDELDRICPVPEEDDTLEEERRKLLGCEKLRNATLKAEQFLCTDEASVLEMLGKAISAITEASRIDPALDAIGSSLKTIAIEFEDTARGLSRYGSALASDPRRLAEVEDRLDAIKRLCRKHCCDLNALLLRRTELDAELATLENRELILEDLRHQRVQKELAAREVGKRLSAARAEVGRRLRAAVEEGLVRLAMEKSRFEVEIRESGRLGPGGCDEIEFLFSANEGEPLRSLSRVASGGEGSRVLLAMKGALAEADECRCYVLDEADAGVNGAAAEVVGRMIKEISIHRQVVFITHLPQVAAYADTHLVVEKRNREGRTTSRVVRLQTPTARTQELARMLSGLRITAEARGAAAALVRSAQRLHRARPFKALEPARPLLPPEGYRL